MTDPSLQLSIVPLLKLAQYVLPRGRRLYNERRAGQVPVLGGTNLLEKGIDETFDRLQKGCVDNEWWRKLLHSIEYEYVTPEFLQKPAIQEWLADERINSNIKVLARACIMGDDTNYEEVRSILRSVYAEKTGENEILANGPIEIVIAVLATGYMASIDSKPLLLAGMIQAVAEENRAGFKEINEKLSQKGQSKITTRLLDEKIEQDLSRIVKRRSIGIDTSRREISVLAQQVWDGDYRHADDSVRVDVLRWAARIHVFDKDSLFEAIQYRDQIRQIKADADTKILDALILETEGHNIDRAIRILRDIDDPDGRAVLFIVLKRKLSKEEALKWFDEQLGRDDPFFLTGFGWSNIAITLAEAGRWEEAADCLYSAREHITNWPDLAFVEGVVNAAMLLPKDYQIRALTMNLFHPCICTTEGPQIARLRARAVECFDLAQKLMTEIGLEGRSHAARFWLLWLRLTDPNQKISEEARCKVQEGLKDGKQAIDLLPFVHAFELTFDPGPVRKYLEQRKRIGGLTEAEIFAEFLLAELTLSPMELADYLNKEETNLTRSVPKAVVTGRRVQALVEAKQTSQARNLLEESKKCFDEDDYKRLLSMIEIEEGAGASTRKIFEELFRKTDELIDLQNLIHLLGWEKDWPALRPLLEELFRRERTIVNARKVVQCMENDRSVDDTQIIEFLNTNDDLVKRDHDLAAIKAWTLSRLGYCRQARAINDELIKNRDNPIDLTLDINLAIQLGDRERFAAIIVREWPRRDIYNPDNLLYLATLASDVDVTADRAFELAKLAVEKSQKDPQILIGAYFLSVQLGREDQPEIAKWMADAIAKSTENGPITKVNIRTVAEEMVPAHRERSRKIDEALLRGEIPLHFVSDTLNVPLSHIFLAIPFLNSGQPDGRRLTIIPIMSGARQPVKINKEWIVGFDATSIMILWYLNLLPKALKAFTKVVLAPDTMTFLLNERRKVRFHQPSRVNKAEELCQLKLKIVQNISEPPNWLIEEVGRDLAELLQLAKTSNGYVIRPFPIHKLSTFMNMEADIKDYSELMMPTITFAKMLLDRGYIDSGIYERAKTYLSAHDRGNNIRFDHSSLDKPLYLDDLAAIYLQEAGILRPAHDSGINIQIHPSLISEQENLIMASREGKKLADRLDDIRSILRTALDEGNAVFLPRSRHDEEKLTASSFQSTLEQFLNSTGQCTAICIDDRFVNKHGLIIDKEGNKVPAICMNDVLYHLECQGLISKAERQEKLHRLREAGFAFVTIDPEGLESMMRKTIIDPGNKLIENAEMRVLRRTLMRIRSLDMIQQPLETLFLDRLRLCCLIFLIRVWCDGNLPIEKTCAISDWVWCNISPTPLDWTTVHDKTDMKAEIEATARHTANLFIPMPKEEGDRQRAFQNWMESNVLTPLLPANPSLVDDIAMCIRTYIEEIIKEQGNAKRDHR